MIDELLEKIKSQTDIRNSLSELRKEIKDKMKKRSLQYKLGNQYELLTELLKHEDAKTRKNAALLLGDLEIEQALKPLYESYIAEDKLFIKSSYLNAIGKLDCSSYVKELKERQDVLLKEEMSKENKKHILEELRELSKILSQFEEIKHHTFTGYEEESQLVLLTNRNYVEATLNQLEGIKAKEFNAGVILQTRELKRILEIRTYQELLFMLPDMKSCKADAAAAAKLIANSSLLEFLTKRHKGEAPFYFRVEVKSKQELDKKSEFAKKLSQELELLTERKLRNNTSQYEFEIRAIQNKEGNFNLLVKLFTVPDERFIYRKNVIATSIKPVNAALTAELAKDYLKPDASVLDPFCGVGTMLIERHKRVKANTMYGLDILEEAILGARDNTKEAYQIAHYINRDFFEFKHEYLFDEVITNMPFQIGRTTQEDVEALYQRFFVKVKEHLKEDGVIILYSHDKDTVIVEAKQNGFRLEQSFEISQKEGTYVIVLKI
ncbi:methyltransferase [Konateibacter massiliensis]|uniref:methyltransferase n=1 Tax=Konateibacter massiliensis TaxID=2002841 RepID=UPI000C160876|nr:methyltransferase [Konateibacter massiliensis]